MRLLAVFALVVLLSGCQRGKAPTIIDYQTLGELRVATRIDTMAYRTDDDGRASGFEHDLLVELGNELGVPVRFVVYPSVQRALSAVRRGDAHLAAAALARNESLRGLRWAPGIRDMKLVIAGLSTLAEELTSADQLDGHTVTARRGTLAAQRLRALQKTVPGMKIELVSGRPDAHLLTELAEGRITLLATDEVHLAVAAVLHPELEVALPLSNTAVMAWALPRHAPQSLVDALTRFVGEARHTGLVTRLEDRYLGHIQRLSQTDIAAFVARMQTRLPRFQAAFEAAGAATGVDWRLLAAVGYQESQWDPFAVSFTGVRGLMMLTDSTAERMGVRDRLDPEQSILGGAKYFALIREAIDPEVEEPDRTWMAVAAYNLGLGHLRGARQIARSMKRDNTTWVSMRGVLPLMSRPSFARRLRAGPARGGEAVIMTENVRAFYDILRRFEPSAPVDGAPQAAGSISSMPPM
ncbi:MAG: membrane-bound lytic murein transglycosylase MltF [Rhodocyclaceae bacterium]|nr:membrane-bound lytic murein transglycosylase MltF [Rhodocyclaceae bacterium]